MAGRLRVSRPVYPLVAVGAALLVLLLGLLLSGTPVVFAAFLAEIGRAHV